MQPEKTLVVHSQQLVCKGLASSAAGADPTSCIVAHINALDTNKPDYENILRTFITLNILLTLV